MDKNNFEKQVQETLAELAIQPSEKAWTGIESRIRKKEPKRRILWIFMLGVLLLGGAAYLFFMDGKSNNNLVSELPKKETKTIIDKDVSDQESLSKTTPITNPITQIETKQVRPKSTDTSSDVLSFSKKALAKTQINPQKNKTNEEIFILKDEFDLENDHQVATKTHAPDNETNALNKQKTDILQTVSDNDSDIRNTARVIQKEMDSTSGKAFSETETLTQKPAINQQVENLIAIKENTDLSGILKEGEKNNLSTKAKKEWEIGVTFSAAKAYIGNGLHLGFGLDKYYSSDPPQYNSPSPGPDISSGVIPGQTATGPASTPENSIGFKTGIVFKKKISSKISFVSGLGYTYYTNSILVGNQMTEGRFGSTGILSPYRNNFHFAYLPVAAQFHFNKKHKIPLDLSVGINISQLVSSDALQYKNGIYIVDNSLFNKTQFDFNINFSTTVFQKLSVGPFYQYGLNSLAGEGIYGKKHLSFLGLKADFLFKKNK